MGVKIRKKGRHWYVFIDHHGQRKAKKVGTREAAEKVKREVEARLALGDFGIFLEIAQPLPSIQNAGCDYTLNLTANSRQRSAINRFSTTTSYRIWAPRAWINLPETS